MEEYWEDKVEEILQVCSLEDALDLMGISPGEAMVALLRHGYVDIPDMFSNNMEVVENGD